MSNIIEPVNNNPFPGTDALAPSSIQSPSPYSGQVISAPDGHSWDIVPSDDGTVFYRSKGTATATDPSDFAGKIYSTSIVQQLTGQNLPPPTNLAPADSPPSTDNSSTPTVVWPGLSTSTSSPTDDVNTVSSDGALPPASAFDFSMPDLSTKAGDTLSSLSSTVIGNVTKSPFSSLLGGFTGSFGGGLPPNARPIETANFMVSLKSKVTGSLVTFYVSPTIDESQTATYEALTPIHHPGSIQVYKSTNATSFNINAKLVSRTVAEATRNRNYLNTLRSWLMPYYGMGTAQEASVKDKLGAPPDILLLNAYGTKNINNMPVILMSRSWNWTDQVDYIKTSDGEPFPIIIDVVLQLQEAHSPNEFTNFDIVKYRQGDLSKAYLPPPAAGPVKGNGFGSILGGFNFSAGLGGLKGAIPKLNFPGGNFSSLTSGIQSGISNIENSASSAISNLENSVPSSVSNVISDANFASADLSNTFSF